MIKPGFTLLEIILATMIAAMISVSLVFMLQQMNTTLVRVDRTSDLHMRAAMLHNQLARDISGAFAPTDFSTKENEAKNAASENKPKKIEKLFWGDHTLQTVTFITNNPMPAYWGERSGKPQPKIVRVVYKLVPSAKRADVFTLMRQEGSDLDFGAYTSKSSSFKAYALVEGIKSIDIDYTTLIKKEQAQNGPAQPTKPEQPEKPEDGTEQPATGETEKSQEQPDASATFERKVVQEWQDNAIDQKPPWPLVPQFVTMQVTLWDDTLKKTTPYTFEFEILPRFEKEAEQKKVGFGLGSFLGGGM